MTDIIVHRVSKINFILKLSNEENEILELFKKIYVKPIIYDFTIDIGKYCTSLINVKYNIYDNYINE